MIYLYIYIYMKKTEISDNMIKRKKRSDRNIWDILYIFVLTTTSTKCYFLHVRGKRGNFWKKCHLFFFPFFLKRYWLSFFSSRVSRSLSVGVSFGEKVYDLLRTRAVQFVVSRSRQNSANKRKIKDPKKKFFLNQKKEKILLRAVCKEKTKKNNNLSQPVNKSCL